MEKIKTILLYVASLVSIALIIYFSFIDPIISGIQKYGVSGSIFKAIEIIALLFITLVIVEYERSKR